MQHILQQLLFVTIIIKGMISYMILQKNKTPCLQLFALNQIIWLHPNPPNIHRYSLITKNLKLIFGSKLLQLIPPRSLSSPSPSAQSSSSWPSFSLSSLPSPLSQQQIFNYQLQHSLPPLSIVICASDQQCIKFFKEQLSTKQQICKKCILLSLGEGESKSKAKNVSQNFQDMGTEGEREGKNEDRCVLANLRQAYDTVQVIKDIDQYLLRENQKNPNKIKQIFNIPIQEPEPIEFRNKISSDIWQNSGIQQQWQIDNQNSQQREQISFIDKFIKKQQQQNMQPKQQIIKQNSLNQHSQQQQLPKQEASSNPTPPQPISQPQPQPPLNPCQQLQTVKAFLSKQPYIRIDECLCVFVYVHHIDSDNRMGEQVAMEDLPQSEIRLINISEFIQRKGKKEQQEQGEGQEKASIVVFSGAVTHQQQASILAIQNLYKWIKFNSSCSKPSQKITNVESIQQMLECLQQIQAYFQNS